jgi:nucleoside-diphosphate-sugar epimerase
VKTADECKGEKYQNVVFCAPPSGFEDYPGAIQECISETWAGSSEGGVFVFTSSGGIYGPGGSELVVVNEDSPLPDPEGNLRSARLISAEKLVLKHGGACLRLAGLYTMDRGAHSFWLMSGKDVTGREDSIINLLHYDDAAGVAKAALLAGSSVVAGNVFLISDGNPLTRRGICESALKAKKYRDMKMPKFVGSDLDPVGKIYDGSASNKALKWDPEYKSFDSFMSSNA